MAKKKPLRPFHCGKSMLLVSGATCHALSSLCSKRFQSSYCAKVRAEAKKRLLFFCCCPSFLDEPREETLATQAKEPRAQLDGLGSRPSRSHYHTAVFVGKH